MEHTSYLADDPYYYLYYGKAARPPSYFTLERTELPEVGRVIRFDSTSKILSGGIRLGFISAPRAIVDAIDLHVGSLPWRRLEGIHIITCLPCFAQTAGAHLQPPGLTQAIAYTLFNHWGYDAFIQHTLNVSAFYGEKCAVFDRAMHKHLAGLAEWTTPQSGMFFWCALRLFVLPLVLIAHTGDISC